MKPHYQLPFEAHPTDTIWTSGQVDATQLAALRADGLEHVINLRPASEDAGFDEVEAAGNLGLRYHVLPIQGAADLNLANAQALDALLKKVGKEPTLIHCASGNRVGALMALREAWINRSPKQQALAVGRSYGLTKLEATVSDLIDQHQAP